MKKLRVLSLFDGISCGLQSLKELGYTVDVYYASEIDKNAIKISQKNHPEVIQIGNVENVDFNQFKDIDLILAGSPCQGFSTYGKMLGFEDPRSKLFFKFVEALRIIKPKYFLLENVVMKKEWLNIIDQELGVKGTIIDSKHFSAQSRKRYYWTNLKINLDLLPNSELCVRDIEDHNPDQNIKWYSKDFFIDKKDKWSSLRLSINNSEKILDSKSRTIYGVYTYGSVPLLKKENGYRLLTIKECERLQTLPDNYTKVDGVNINRRYDAIKNGWNIETIKWILSNIEK